MILLTVLSFNGAATAGLAASFDELGGSIGRADSNQLVLPDPERSISRVHARVVFRAGSYALVDCGSNPVSINGRTLGSGVEHPLKPGDQVLIGGYLLSVSAAAAAPTSSDPFADLFGDVGNGLAAPVAAPAPAWAAPSPAPTPPPTMAAGQIPDDWDPFASLAAPAPRASAPASQSAASAGFGDLQLSPTPADSLDDLFGLGPGAASADPFGALTAPGSRPSLADHGSELNAAMPRVRAEATPPPAAAPSLPPAGAVFSWLDEPAEQIPHTVPSFVSRPEPEPVKPVAVALAPVPAAPAPTPAAGEAALLSALLAGLGSPGLRIEALTPDLMRLIGALLRESTRGSVELLVARAALKREMRAEMTMIVARENNPLKFSPSAEVALQYLLSPPLPGFMAAEPAMRDAFDDLRAHQLAVMAGMRSALDGVLQRFNPQQLESELTQRSAISSLLPALRKARLWDLFQDLFAQLSTEAQDAFEDLFGQAFLDAYEEQLDRLAAEPRAT